MATTNNQNISVSKLDGMTYKFTTMLTYKDALEALSTDETNFGDVKVKFRQNLIDAIKKVEFQTIFFECPPV